jgi:hypothetical protein
MAVRAEIPRERGTADTSEREGGKDENSPDNAGHRNTTRPGVLWFPARQQRLLDYLRD